MQKSYVYILRCADGSLYTGWTNDPARRLRAHNEGRGAQYTKSHRPVTPVYQEECADKADGLRREYAIKKMSGVLKLALIAQARINLYEEEWTPENKGKRGRHGRVKDQIVLQRNSGSSLIRNNPYGR